MALRKSDDITATPASIKPLSLRRKENGKAIEADTQKRPTEADVDIDLREVYFLIMQFLSAGPCHTTSVHLRNELLEHQLLPRRYHAWYSRSGLPSGDENDDGLSFPVTYNTLLQRHPHVGKDHLVKLLKQLLIGAPAHSRGLTGGTISNAATVPTLLGTGSFSVLSSDHGRTDNEHRRPPSYMRWPHRLADQVRGLSLRELGGGFSRHHRAPSIRAACYAIAKPSTMVQKMQNVKSVRGHRNSVYCATFDQSGRYVITGSDDRLVKIWSMETAYCLASCRGHEGDITDLAVNFNNTVVASAANDCVIRVWRLPDGMPISILRGHTGVVTAIEFSPRPGAVYQLLSSSDDGTCRLWDARYSHFTPRIYVPKPSDAPAGRSSVPSSITIQQNHQIFCCTFNASGTVFVTGSSDTLARVWSACKSSVDDSDQPNHEIDILSGHENDVNYVQFSGCAVNTRFLSTEGIKEDSPKFKNTWFHHDNIVTCSRDGSAIIWIPRSRRSHGKTGRWVRAYHLKVPPPPMAPQPSRGGPRQRMLPTPRGVNMITWSLDNRFVLAAIMDCRICVWNAIDGSLVHSLTGHTDSTYVLDVHPFNPRIAMSAGYDGKTIIWDIWEGTPIRTFVIGPFKLVDGKFSPDGTSIILSDDVGQLYILSTGQGESHRDAKYDQFFLGDYRPLVQDAHGNVLDQETQLVPYRRNMQDLLCDSGMIPYPEPYQSMFQRRRLGALGIEWRPSSVKFAVGVDFNLDPNYQMPPIVDLDTLIDPLPDFVDVMDWEPEIGIHSDDNDSEYRIADDSLSGAEQLSLSSDSGEPECSENSDVESEDTQRDRHRRSKRKKLKGDVMTSSGRRVKRRNLDVQDDSVIRTSHSRKSRNGPKSFRKKSSSKLRPRRAAARNALHLFTRISTDGEEDASDGDTSESGSTLPESSFETEESDESLPNEWCERPEDKEIFLDRHVDEDQRQLVPEPYSNASSKGRIILKLPYRNSNKFASQQSLELKCAVNESDMAGPSSRTPQKAFRSYETCLEGEKLSAGLAGDGEREQSSKSVQPYIDEPHLDLLEGLKCGPTSWGGFKARRSKRLKVGEPTVAGIHPVSDSFPYQNLETVNTLNGHSTYLEQEEMHSPTSGIQSGRTDGEGVGELMGLGNSSFVYNNQDAVNGSVAPSEICINGIENNLKLEEKSIEISTRTPQKLRIKSLSRSRDGSTSKTTPESLEEEKLGATYKNAVAEHTSDPRIHVHDDDTVGAPGTDGLANGSSSGSQMEEPPKSDSNRRMFTAVYQRSRFSRNKSNPEYGCGNTEASTSSARPYNLNGEIDIPPEGFRRARSIRFKSSARDLNASVSNFGFKEPRDDSKITSSDVDKASPSVGEENSSEDLKPISRSSILLRSTRAKNYVRNASPPRKSSETGKTNWLLMSVLDEGYRYVPQKGDEVAYLRQGHQEYLNDTNSRINGPWETFKRSTIRAVEFCRVESLEYSTHPGSGESCCKLTLKFSDPSSAVLGKSFKLTLPEVTSFPEFLVEKSRYEASIARNWTTRDKCQVWWKNEGVEDGSWWEGRILNVKPKSPDFPDSPWEKFAVKYKSNPTETHHHSPWELHDADTHLEQPRIDEEKKEKLIRAFSKLEQSGNKAQDYYGVSKLRQVSEKANFTNRFPVPLSLEVIQSRLENSYYRSMEALEHDIEVMLSNAESFFARNAEMSKKVKRLSEWFQKTLSSL